VRQAIVAFVRDVTTKGGPRYVAPEDRIATFDNDGTLWIEKPHYVELMYLLDHIRKRAPEHPPWEHRQPFRDLLRGESGFLDLIEIPDLVKLSIDAFAEMTTEQFSHEAGTWLGTARHPRFNRLYKELTYAPQRELMDYLRDNGFQVYICTGGGVDFLRIYCWGAYGVPWANVIGSHPKIEFRERDGGYVILRKVGEGLVNDKENKPLNIELHVGRRPILAFGNSDGDIEMLEWAESTMRPFLSLLLVHDDPAREYAYTNRSEKALDLANKHPWTLVRMKSDWLRVFPFNDRVR
jgi:hypothetical protein